MAYKWLIVADLTGIVGTKNGAVVHVEGTGYSQLDGYDFALHVPADTHCFLLSLDYAGNTSGSYPDEAYIVNEYDSTIGSGTIRQRLASVSGLDHLEGLSVSGLADGEVLPSLLVEDGEVSLPGVYDKVLLGLSYTTYHEPTGVAMNAESGSKTDQTARIHSVSIRFMDTLDAEVATCNGTATSNESLTWRPIGWKEDLSTSVETDLFAGLVKIPLESNFSVEPRVILKQDKPLPMNVLAVTYNYKITGGR